jgi:hypothetical protein
MWQLAIPRPLRLLALVVLAVVVAACSRDSRSDPMRPAIAAPASFDVTLIADKDNQFDYQNVPLTAQDLRAALNYRKEQGLPMATVLLKRGEKNRIKDTHIVALARIAVALGFTSFVEEKGETKEIQLTITDKPAE